MQVQIIGKERGNLLLGTFGQVRGCDLGNDLMAFASPSKANLRSEG